MNAPFVIKRGPQRVGDASSYILPLGLLALAGFGVWYFVTHGLTSDTGANNAAVDANTGASAAGELAKSQAAGIPQTISDSTLSGYADQVLSQLTSGDQSGAVQTLTQVNTLTDWNRLVQLFGTRKVNLDGGVLDSCALFGVGCDSTGLVQLIKSSLDGFHLQNLNTYFSEQGINIYL